MHAVVDLDGISAERVHAEAMSLGVETMPLSAYFAAPRLACNALLLGFGSVPPASIRTGVAKLARAIDHVRR